SKEALNRMTKTKIAILVLVLLVQAASAVRQSPSKLVLRDCDVQNVQGKAKCGTLEVYENRATKKGRMIGLNIVVLPATGDKREPDPIVYFAGGPGSSATEEGPGIAQAFPQLHEHRDLLLVDQRGTGGSNPLNCDLYDPADLQSYLGYFFPLEAVRKCRTQLETKADLKLYTTAIAADDMDEVRAALGYEQLNLIGGSYGTRAALTYLKRYPKHVRTATLQGVSPTNHYMPGDFPQQTERALQGVIGECAADAACSKAFPNLKDEAKSVLAQLIKGPIEVEVQKPNSSEHAKVKLSRDLAAEAIRYMLYNPVSASRVPLMLHRAAEGNFVPLAQAALRYRMILVTTGSNGMYLSVTCAEDLPWIKPGEGERMAENTFLGDYRLRQQREACELWPRGSIERDYGEPIRSDVPVLILTGEWDPVTPPSNGATVAKTLTNSLNIVVPHGAHGQDGLEGIDCIDRLMVEFMERGTVKGLDTTCVQSIHRKGFALRAE
ncbi:MAG TPA: alpha/beta fold hydrolase, partial [Pyrinomonadaceae bacterium]|nr:alpha/beta fold hydrolase [Pyrinomonadaceae bacterium]